jgi:ribose-phosphate pyrophosphokinase
MNADEKHDRKPQRVRVDDKFKIFCGTANMPLADEVCAFLSMNRGQALVTRFADGEAYVQIQENVRGADVFIMQPTCRPVDPAFDGVAVNDRCSQARLGAAQSPP